MKGNPNVQHVKPLFEAQKATIRKKHAEADKHFQVGIALAARGGFIQDAAIGSELYAKYLLSARDDRQGASFHFRKAAEFYTEWDALKKVDLLNEKYSDILLG